MFVNPLANSGSFLAALPSAIARRVRCGVTLGIVCAAMRAKRAPPFSPAPCLC
jgi:hypothetical protein